METLSQLRALLGDGRFDANLIAGYGLIVVTVITALVVRRLLARHGTRFTSWAGIHWLEAVGDEAVRRARSLVFWSSFATTLLIAAGGVAYHFAGRDVREDLQTCYAKMTPEDLLKVGLATGALAGLAVGTRFAVWWIRRLRPNLQRRAMSWSTRIGNEASWRRWFHLLERYAVASVRLLGLWTAGQVIGLGGAANVTIGFVFRVASIIVVARLLTLGSGAALTTIANLGDRHMSKGHLHRYWERITRLFPFGQRCFEAAVFISAASLCVRELHFISVVADFGTAIVQCIGIFFGTRVVIELSQVLLNEAFGLYDERRMLDQKGRTLVPLLHSICQYVLYFGSSVIMLGVLGVPTAPILAGAGIVGMAVGLGANSLVTDVVSGFFILFEGQYLVGDFVQIGDAAGIVEAVGIRLTQVRDGQGKLYLIPNGQIKGVVNYSKGYVNAVVDIRVPSGSDLEGVFRSMTEAGRRLRKASNGVLADTEIQGLIELTTSEMTIRAVTKVEPGSHVQLQNEYRRLLKQVFDQNQLAAKPSLAA